MPNMDCELQKLSESRCFASFDLSYGYWLLPQHEGSPISQYFVTTDGIFSPTRALHGTTIEVRYLQAAMGSMIYKSLINEFLACLDDFLAHAGTVENQLGILRKYFHLCTVHRIKLLPLKC